MPTVLSHTSAMQCGRSQKTLWALCSDVLRANKLISKPSRSTESIERMLEELSLPLHILVRKGSHRRPTKHYVFHEWGGPFPKGTILDTGRGFYVSSPEFCFIQMASSLSIFELIELGYELCGTYISGEKKSSHIFPATTVSKLKRFASKIDNANGIKKVNRALRHVLNGSGSPMETKLVMLLCLPYKLGGYGIPKPSLNHRIDLRGYSGQARYYRCDLFWPEAGLAIEYDSNRFHTGASRIAYDSIRRNELAALGITVVTMTKNQIRSSFEVEKLAYFVAKSLGKRIRCPESSFVEARFNLRSVLGVSTDFM